MTGIDRVFRTNLEVLLSNASGIRDGNAGAVHDARIATRRLRALLPIALAVMPERQRDAVSSTLRRIGRTLGAVRDTDVSLEQLDGLELRIPSASCAITALRLMLLERQAFGRRRMLKRLEQVPFDDLVAVARPLGSRFAFTRAPGVKARATATAIDSRTRKLWESVERAGGVYFPNRTHAVRIAAKKLRYLLEFTLEGAERKRTLKRLRRVQQQLGHLHDRQTLADVVEAARANDDTDAVPDYEYAALLAWIHDDIRRVYAEYVGEARESLRRVVRELVRHRQSDRAHTWLAVGAFAAPSLAFWLSRRPRAQPSSSLRTERPADCAATVS
jgi:CHAD domain-containing protein